MALTAKTFAQLFTFTRASSGTRVNASGLIESIASNLPRYDYDPVTLAAKGILIEEQRTNLLTYSEQFDNAIWTKTRSSITANATTAPDGTTTADKLVEDATATNTHQIAQTASFTAGTAYTQTVFAKAGERSKIELRLTGAAFSSNQAASFDLATGAIATAAGAPVTSIEQFPNGWWRCRITATADVTSTASATMRLSNGATTSYTGDGTSGLYIWGAQVGAGADPAFYIPTVASQVTRAADVMRIEDLTGWFNQSEGTFVIEASSRSAAADTTLFCVDDGTTGQADQFDARISSGTSYRARTRTAATTSADLNPGSFAVGSTNKLAWAYKENDYAASLNGAAVVVDTSGAMPITAMTRLRFFERGATGPATCGHIKNFSYYPKRLTNAELVELTT
jgi:hypothetical protein